MKKARLCRSPKNGLLACFAGAVLVAHAQSDSVTTFGGDPQSSSFLWIPSDTDDWTRHFRIGAMVGLNISASFNEHGLFNVSGNNPANGIFDNGYVRTDSSGNDFGYTSNWGYNNGSQYNYAAQTVTMQGASSYSTSGSSKDAGGAFAGFDMAYGDNLWYWKHARIGWELGFGLLPINIKDNSPLSATINSSSYTFDTSNPGNAAVSSAPYSGSYNRQPYEWTIADSPEQITALAPSQGSVTGSRELDVVLYAFRFGPSLYWDFGKYAGMSLGAGPAVGVVSGNYKYNEIITASGVSAHNSGEFGTTDMTFGGYVSGELMCHVQANGNADIYLGAQYMPMEDVTFSHGGREGKLNLSGQLYISVGINWPF